MLARLAGMRDPLLISSYLDDIIAPAFRGIIADNHFRIHHPTFPAPALLPYMNGQFVLRKGEAGFVTEIDEVRYRVLEVPAENILPTLTAEGELAWAFGLVAEEGGQGETEITAVLEDVVSGEKRSMRIALQKVVPRELPAGPAVSVREEAGVPVLENRSLSNLSDAERDIFSRASSELRDKPVLVVDLRGNTGGILNLARRWVAEYSGSHLFFESLFAESDLMSTQVAFESVLGDFPARTLVASVSRAGRISSDDPRFVAPEAPGDTGRRFSFTATSVDYGNGTVTLDGDTVSISSPAAPFFGRTLTVSGGSVSITGETVSFTGNSVSMSDTPDPAWDRPLFPTSVSRIPPREAIPNGNLAIVLTDKNTGSAGEIFVGFLRQLENVIVVGSNTRGMFLTNSIGSALLPHSKLPVRFGTRLNFRPDLSQFEGVGFMPDLWVPPGESLERVLRFIEREGLEENVGR